MKFRKKPLVIEVEQFLPFEDDMGKYENLVRKFTPCFLKDFFYISVYIGS